ncbi:PEP-CTERM sorting domain-containing protein [Sphingomonas pituitosa]|uniref:PEP-CTERM sorting domain-containing protein n=1 Tax=Sphingomonas pituitosa TaxID=99597 RepID=UPI00083284C1|nr:PEP-CTERM sorting domain-containing protein [Sphingomonas pituitosa]
MRISVLIAASCLITAGSGAAAAPVTYSGSGTLSQVLGKLPLTGSVPVGSSFSFSFTFDPAKAALFESSDGYAIYDLALSNAAITLGSYSYPLSPEAVYTPFIELYRAFSFFPGSNMSEEALAFTFFLAGKPTMGDAAEPFGGSAGKTQLVSIGGVLRQANNGQPLTLDSIFVEGATYYTNFEYGARDPAIRQSGSLRGSYAGGFSSGVPEPDHWALLIAGIGITGGIVRRRRNTSAFGGLARCMPIGIRFGRN